MKWYWYLENRVGAGVYGKTLILTTYYYYRIVARTRACRNSINTNIIQIMGRHATVFQAEVHAIELDDRENLLRNLKHNTNYLSCRSLQRRCSRNRLNYLNQHFKFLNEIWKICPKTLILWQFKFTLGNMWGNPSGIVDRGLSCFTHILQQLI